MLRRIDFGEDLGSVGFSRVAVRFYRESLVVLFGGICFLCRFRIRFFFIYYDDFRSYRIVFYKVVFCLNWSEWYYW